MYKNMRGFFLKVAYYTKKQMIFLNYVSCTQISKC